MGAQIQSQHVLLLLEVGVVRGEMVELRLETDVALVLNRWTQLRSLEALGILSRHQQEGNHFADDI